MPASDKASLKLPFVLQRNDRSDLCSSARVGCPASRCAGHVDCVAGEDSDSVRCCDTECIPLSHGWTTTPRQTHRRSAGRRGSRAQPFRPWGQRGPGGTSSVVQTSTSTAAPSDERSGRSRPFRLMPPSDRVDGLTRRSAIAIVSAGPPPTRGGSLTSARGRQDHVAGQSGDHHRGRTGYRP